MSINRHGGRTGRALTFSFLSYKKERKSMETNKKTSSLPTTADSLKIKRPEESKKQKK